MFIHDEVIMSLSLVTVVVLTHIYLFVCQILNRHPPFGNQIKEAVSKLPKYEVSLEQVTCIYNYIEVSYLGS